MNKKVQKAFIEKMYQNGGHWVELEMKKGGKVRVQRMAATSFEDLERDKFYVQICGEVVERGLTLEQLADYLINYKSN